MMGAAWRVKVATRLMLLAGIDPCIVCSVLENAPDQPVKVDPASGVAVIVMVVPAAKVVPLGLVVTVPVPVPDFAMVRVYEEVAGVKVAAMVWLAVTLEKV